MNDFVSENLPAAPPVRIEYARPLPPIERVLSRLRPAHFALVSGFGGVVLSRHFGASRAPYLLAVAVGVFCAALWLGFARVRRWDAARRYVSVWSDLLLLAALASVAGVLLSLNRSRIAQGPGDWQYWFTHNPGYRYGPLWAIGPLWITAAGVVCYFAILIVAVVQERMRRMAPGACPSPRVSE
jgi:hypothetical protein